MAKKIVGNDAITALKTWIKNNFSLTGHSHSSPGTITSGSGTSGSFNLDQNCLYILEFTLDNSWYEQLIVLTNLTNRMHSITIGRCQNYYWRFLCWGDWTGCYIQRSTDGVTWENVNKTIYWTKIKIT